jgi:hypothetical protein
MLAGLRWKGSEARQHRAERKEAKSAGRAGTRSRKKPEARRYLDGDADAHSSGATASNLASGPLWRARRGRHLDHEELF